MELGVLGPFANISAGPLFQLKKIIFSPFALGAPNLRHAALWSLTNSWFSSVL